MRRDNESYMIVKSGGGSYIICKYKRKKTRRWQGIFNCMHDGWRIGMDLHMI